MPSSNDTIHGLAAKIRSATESETFDLGGMPDNTVKQVIQDAFQEDWQRDDDASMQQSDNTGMMIRLTVIVGAGKQNRQKYGDNTGKIVMSALNKCNYKMDNSASCIQECAGLYKQQHDTGKNLKTIVIFPRFVVVLKKDDDDGVGSSTISSLLPPTSTTNYKTLTCSMGGVVFENLLKHKVPSWQQKRNLMEYLEQDILQGQLQECDALLLKGQILSTEQQQFYDACVSISDKRDVVKQSMAQQVEDGELTEVEKEFLLEQISRKIEELKSSGNDTNNPAALQKAQQRRDKLHKIQPIDPAPLKHYAALSKLWKQAAPLLYLQQKQHQQHLTLQETKKLSQLEDILSEIADLEQDSQGWLEDDDIFEVRIQDYRRELQQKYSGLSSGNSSNNKSNNKSGGGSNKSGNSKKNKSSNTGFQLPRSTAGGGWMSAKDKKAQALQAKKARQKKGDVFGAAAAMMMMDDDSDSDSDNSDDDNDQNDDRNANDTTANQTETSKTPPTAANPSSSSNKRKKKKKGKKGGGGNQSNGTDNDDDILNAAVAANRKAAAEKGKQDDGATAKDQVTDGNGGVLSFILSIFRDYLLPFLIAILTWLASLVVGSSSKSNKKKKKRS